MKKIFDFKCPDGHVFEKMVEGNVEAHTCVCGKNATKQLSAPALILNGSSGDFPGRHLRWVKEHEKAGRKAHSKMA